MDDEEVAAEGAGGGVAQAAEETLGGGAVHPVLRYVALKLEPRVCGKAAFCTLEKRLVPLGGGDGRAVAGAGSVRRPADPSLQMVHLKGTQREPSPGQAEPETGSPRHDQCSPRPRRLSTQAGVTPALNAGLALVGLGVCLFFFNVACACGTTFQRYGKGMEITSSCPLPDLSSREHRVTSSVAPPRDTLHTYANKTALSQNGSVACTLFLALLLSSHGLAHVSMGAYTEAPSS